MIHAVHRSKYIVNIVQLFSVALLFASNICAMGEDALRVSRSSLIVPGRLGSVELFHNGDEFQVVSNDEVHSVKRYWVDPLLRNVREKQLKAFLDNGYVSLDQMSDGEYTIKAKVRGLGGGPVTGWIFYVATKGICYGTAAAAAGSAVALTGGAIAAAGGLVAAGASTGVIAAAGTATASSMLVTGAATGTIAGATALTGGAAMGVATATAGIIGGTAGAASTATLATAGAIGAGGSIAGAVAAVETLSTGAFIVGSALWFLP